MIIMMIMIVIIIIINIIIIIGRNSGAYLRERYYFAGVGEDTRTLLKIQFISFASCLRLFKVEVDEPQRKVQSTSTALNFEI